MSRYIDADALITDLNKGLWGKDWDKVLAEAIINDAPSIDICFCRECKYREKCEQIVVFEIGENQVEGRRIDFCSYGEREGE